MSEDVLVDLPPSAKLVHTVLEHEGPLTQGAIATHSRLSPRTVRHATAILEEHEVVHAEPYQEDRRRSVYRLR